MKRILFLSIAAISLFTVSIEAARAKSEAEYRAGNKCYCSGICAVRDVTSEDNPVYVENDPNGNYYYCKQWDIDAYEERCQLNNNK
jgi:hypothetical protein